MLGKQLCRDKETGQPGKGFPRNPEDMGWMSRLHIKGARYYGMLATPEETGQANHWGVLARQLNLITDPQIPVKDPISIKQDVWCLSHS